MDRRHSRENGEEQGPAQVSSGFRSIARMRATRPVTTVSGKVSNFGILSWSNPKLTLVGLSSIRSRPDENLSCGSNGLMA